MSARAEAVERALMAAWCNPPTSSGMTDAEAFCTALAADGYAVVSVEPTWEIRSALQKWAHPDDQWRDALAAAKETQA